MFFKEFYINYFNISYNSKNIKESENTSRYTLTLFDITQFDLTIANYNKFIDDYIDSKKCSIEFTGMFNDSTEVEDINFLDCQIVKDINDIGLKNLCLIIRKPENEIVIFDTYYFFQNLKDLSIKRNIDYISKANNIYVFDFDEDINNGYFFINKFTSPENYFKNTCDHGKKIDERNGLAFFYNALEYNFIPDFFYFQEIKNEHFNSYFKFLLFISSIIFISDYSFIKDEEFTFKIKDTKFSLMTYDKFLDLYKLHPDIADNYYEIYNWIYNDNMFTSKTDKFEIASYTIDKCKTSNDMYIEKNVIDIIKNSFTLYLKENVDKYLIFKQQIVNNITSSLNECTKILNDITKMHNQFLLSIFTVLFSLLIGDAISNTANVSSSSSSNTQINIFTNEVSIIFFILIIIIFILSFFNKNEAIKKVNKIIKVSDSLQKNIKEEISFKGEIFEFFDINQTIEEINKHQFIFYVILGLIIGTIIFLNKFL